MESIKKRDGRIAAWDLSKIERAVARSFAETGEAPAARAAIVALQVQDALQVWGADWQADIERVQDEVEHQLMLMGLPATAKAYILYRDERARRRALAATVPEEAHIATAQSRGMFPDALSEFVYYRSYSRWVQTLGRREVWKETVGRYMDFMHERLGGALTTGDYVECEGAILRMEVMPSMRLLWSAGAAARATNVAAFNCAYLAPASPRDFGELLYVSACGVGVGFSAESRNVQALPVVRRAPKRAMLDYEVGDSKEGWAEALRVGLETWYEGGDVKFDLRGIRPEGARLLTMGGRASGPAPLAELLAYARRMLLSRQGRRLANIDVHDLVCKTGDCIVAGGMRRTALISLSDLDDVAMRSAKSGPYGSWPKHRELANNSAVYEDRPDSAVFMREWLALAESGTGERGIFNRGGLVDQVPERRLQAWAEMGEGEFVDDGQGGWFSLLAQVGANPCGEINLLSKQFCNLTEAVCRPDDSRASLHRKVRIASILGTYQSTLTDFQYLSPEWKANCERERLLGVSLTGQWECPLVMNKSDLIGPSVLRALRNEAVATNRLYAHKMGIGASTAVTCGKPSGTVSQLVDASSGGHPRFAPYYIRRVRISATDPLFRVLRDQGVPHKPDNGMLQASATTFVFEFPVKAPDGARCAGDVTAMDQLAHWLRVKAEFTEHNPSITVYVGPDEWFDVGHWVWKHWDMVGGLAFLPRADGHVYPLAPYEEITRERYDEMVRAAIRPDYALLAAYEKEDEGTGSKEAACTAGECEL